MKKLFFVVIVLLSVNLSFAKSKTQKATGDKPTYSRHYTDYNAKDSLFYAQTVYTYNDNKQTVKEVTTHYTPSGVDSIVNTYNSNNWITSSKNYEDGYMYSMETWTYNTANKRIDYDAGEENNPALHAIYYGVENFDEVDDYFSDLFSPLFSFMGMPGMTIVIRDCDSILINMYTETSTEVPFFIIYPKYDNGKPKSVEILFLNDEIIEMIGDMIVSRVPPTMIPPGTKITAISIDMTTKYSGDKLEKISGKILLTNNILPTIAIENFIVLTNKYNNNLLTETKVEIVAQYAIFREYLGGFIQKYGYNSENNISVLINEFSENGNRWEIEEKTYFHYGAVGIKNINGVTVTALSQNIPNPANALTCINYTVPNDGKVMFIVYNINGQVLFTQSNEAKAGENTLELQVGNLPAGLYFYSMEFDKQRIVRKMSVE